MWELNQELMWVKRNERGHIIAVIDIDTGYFTNKQIVTLRLINKRPKKKIFDSIEDAREYVKKLIKKY